MTIEHDERVGACWECGYSLRGLTTPRCPECGRKFDPADERTMNMGWEVRRVVKWLMRPPGWPTHLLTGAAVIMSLWAAAAPMGRDSFMDLLNLRVLSIDYYQELRTMIWELGDPLGRFLLGAILWLMVAVVWISRRVARGVTVKRLSKQKAAPLAYWRRWLVTPVVFGITVLLCRSTLPAWAGFWISKPWMESAVEEARIAAGRTATAGGAGWPGAATPDRWIGIYPPSPTPTWGGQVQWHRGEATVHVSNNARRNPMGYFVYRNDGQAPELMPFGGGAYSTGNRVRHLYGPWYVVEVYPYGER
jgi:hypothetical protein